MSRRTPFRHALLLLALLGFARPSAALGALQDPPRLRVDLGQALAVGPEGVRRLFAGEGESELLGVYELEVPPGSRASLRWPGRASVGLEGPAGISFGSGSGAATLRWALRGRGAFELEVRRGSVSTELAPGWNAALEAGAWRLVGLPDESARLLHRAGAPLHLFWTGRRGEVVPPIELRAGHELRLGAAAPSALRAEHARPGGAWSGDGSWPFSAQAGPAQRAPSHTPAAGRVAHSQRSSALELAIEGPPEWPWSDGTDRSGIDAIEHAATQGDPLSEQGAVDHADAVEPAVEAAPEVPGPSAPTASSALEWTADPGADRAASPGPWRGLAPAELATWGTLRHEPSPFLRVEPRASGGAWLLLDPAAPSALWVFAPRRDYRLAPGAVMLLEGTGELRARAGRVEAFEAGPRD